MRPIFVADTSEGECLVGSAGVLAVLCNHGMRQVFVLSFSGPFR